MLGDTIRCKKALTQLAHDYYDELASWTLTADNWAFIEQTHKALLPFNEYTKLISEGRPTINQSIALFYELSDHDVLLIWV